MNSSSLTQGIQFTIQCGVIFGLVYRSNSRDLIRIFGIHLTLASLVCFAYGLCHLTGLYGPGMWTSDSRGLLGALRFVNPVHSILGLGPFPYGASTSHHCRILRFNPQVNSLRTGYLGDTCSRLHDRSKVKKRISRRDVFGDIVSGQRNIRSYLFKKKVHCHRQSQRCSLQLSLHKLQCGILQVEHQL